MKIEMVVQGAEEAREKDGGEHLISSAASATRPGGMVIYKGQVAGKRGGESDEEGGMGV